MPYAADIACEDRPRCSSNPPEGLRRRDLSALHVAVTPACWPLPQPAVRPKERLQRQRQPHTCHGRQHSAVQEGRCKVPRQQCCVCIWPLLGGHWPLVLAKCGAVHGDHCIRGSRVVWRGIFQGPREPDQGLRYFRQPPGLDLCHTYRSQALAEFCRISACCLVLCIHSHHYHQASALPCFKALPLYAHPFVSHSFKQATLHAKFCAFCKSMLFTSIAHLQGKAASLCAGSGCTLQIRARPLLARTVGAKRRFPRAPAACSAPPGCAQPPSRHAPAHTPASARALRPAHMSILTDAGRS